MRKIIVAMHTSLDGFVAGQNGEMDWIKLDDALFDFVGTLTAGADTALYGRKTYEMMDSYWPTAGDPPNASKHDREHSRWYNDSLKIVLSKTLHQTGLLKTKIISTDIVNSLQQLKQEEGKNIIIFGSASATHFLFNEGLIDEVWLFVNPVVLGQGIPMFKDVIQRISLTFIESKSFACGVAGLHYKKEQVTK